MGDAEGCVWDYEFEGRLGYTGKIYEKCTPSTQEAEAEDHLVQVTLSYTVR